MTYTYWEERNQLIHSDSVRISFGRRGATSLQLRNKGNRRRLHAGNFTAVLLFRARFYNLLWRTQIYILKWDSHCSGENITKQRVNKRHLDRFDGKVRSVITPVKSNRIKKG